MILNLHFSFLSDLVFPALDELPSNDAPRTKKESMKHKGKFVTDYLDKRAQVAFSMENPD